jgi:hypothetical protein
MGQEYGGQEYLADQTLRWCYKAKYRVECCSAYHRHSLRSQAESGSKFAADSFRPAEGRLGLALPGASPWLSVVDGELREKEQASPEPSQRGIMRQQQIE